HRAADRLAKRIGGDGNAGADDGEDQRIFGRRGARLVTTHVDEITHRIFLPAKMPPRPFALARAPAFALIGRKAMLPRRGRWNREKVRPRCCPRALSTCWLRSR